ncbi:hypothetical protein [Herbidospora sp. NBRC 101105]|uniref:hypothetical protein n=1 Tax=Herbidospora sp. NBRC 101105 TaxID=3032195 RepID=UPI0024A0B83D|nr:hypothetical protein [Herbidospora sp. NBRC 101105]GLX98134.1 hypothetical protein Hesp01_60840 [Herbidospora sp. NBRC 101105]
MTAVLRVGPQLGTDADAAENVVIAVTTGELDDVTEIAKRLRALDGGREPTDS